MQLACASAATRHVTWLAHPARVSPSQGGTNMTDYERTTTRETTTNDPAAPVYTEPGAAAASSVRTTERAYVAPGPSGVTTAARVVTFLFGILQAALILRIILLLLVAHVGNDVVSLILNITDPFVEPF